MIRCELNSTGWPNLIMLMAGQLRDWQSRAQHHAPQLASATLCALIVLELVRVSSTVRQPDPAVASPASEGPGSSIPAASYAERIAAAHLFGVVAGPEPRTGEVTLSSTLVLDGTLATSNPKHGYAIIHDAGEVAHVYAVGVPQGDLSLRAVYQDHVIVDQRGIQEILRLPQASPGASLSPLQKAARASVPARLYVDNRGRTLDKAPGPLDEIVRTVMSYEADGQKLRGYLVYPVASGDPLRVMGLNPGDLLTEVNGTLLNDQKRSQELLSSLNRSGQVSVTFERQGQKQTATFDMAEARQAGMP